MNYPNEVKNVGMADPAQNSQFSFNSLDYTICLPRVLEHAYLLDCDGLPPIAAHVHGCSCAFPYLAQQVEICFIYLPFFFLVIVYIHDEAAQAPPGRQWLPPRGDT
mmetsp:Transcript_65125/g.146364  ORF Transcript_65125/g.146364 Transcript_65125/m.146364 type:complete len:106 (+) Transcript_65125:827-1144(+)